MIRSAETALRLVPDDFREASAALGARTSRTILTVVIPAALPGIVSGALPPWPAPPARRRRCCSPSARPTPPTRACSTAPTPAFSANSGNARQPFEAAIDRAWGAALTLILLVFVLTAVARLIARRFTVR